MKKIIKPAEQEEALYFTDFKGQPCDECGPEVELKLQFNYGSKYDGDSLVLHLNDEEAESVLNLIKQNISQDFKQQLQAKYEKTEKDYQDSFQFRDWTSCDYTLNSMHLLEYLLGYNKPE